MKKAYFVEAGILLEPGDREYETYNIVYGGKHAYYDELMDYYPTQEEAENFVKWYVNDGVNKTFGVITEQFVEDDFFETYDPDDLGFSDIDFSEQAVISSRVKLNGTIIENFTSKTDDELFKKGA